MAPSSDAAPFRRGAGSTSLWAAGTAALVLAAVPPDQQQAGGDGPFLHSGKFVLVDASGRVRGYYDSDDEAAMRRLLEDLARVRS